MPVRSRYPLAALEGLRLRQRDSARGELATAIADAAAARRREEAAAGALREANRVRRTAEAKGSGRSAMELDAHGRWLARLRSSERLLEEETGRRQVAANLSSAEVEGRRDQLLEAERRLRTVERHRALWERARRRAAQSAEEAEQEDLAGSAGAQRPT